MFAQRYSLSKSVRDLAFSGFGLAYFPQSMVAEEVAL